LFVRGAGRFFFFSSLFPLPADCPGSELGARFSPMMLREWKPINEIFSSSYCPLFMTTLPRNGFHPFCGGLLSSRTADLLFLSLSAFIDNRGHFSLCARIPEDFDM